MSDPLPPHDYVPPGPLDASPPGGYQPREVRRDAFAAVLDRIPRGGYDDRIVEWLTALDDPTCQTVTSLLWRCRQAGMPGAVTEWAIAYTHRPSLGLSPRRVVQPYPDEAMAREAVADIRRMEPGDEPAVMCRQVGPWKEVPDA